MNSSAATVAERVRELAVDLNVNLNGQADASTIQFAVPSWCHSQDNKPSLTIGTHESGGGASADAFPLVYCHGGCDYPTVREALVQHGARSERLRPAGARKHPTRRSVATPGRPTDRPTAPMPTVAHTVWLRWHDALLRNPDQLAYLCDEKGIREDTVRAMCLGWTGKRISIPVFDREGRCVNLRLYLPHAGKGDDKIVNYFERGAPSFGRNRLYVPSEHLDPSRVTLHCAGELDAILGWQHGWQTSTQTGGESSRFPAVDAEWMRGQEVVVAYDNDDTGQRGAAKTARELASVARSVRIADLSTLDLPDKGDLGDVWRREDLGSAAVRGVVAAATSWGGDQGAGNSWLPVDVTAVLDGTHEPLQPTVCRRGGEGLALFYPGKSHALIAESEAGKTWLALFAAKQEVEQGHHVYFYDFEDNEVGVVGRLLTMDTDPTALRSHFHYVRPDEPLSDEVRTAWIAEHESRRPSLVIVDGVTEVMTQHGWGQNDNADVAAFYRLILRPMADLGAAVVALDHLPKYDEKGRGAIGGVHKLNGIDGTVYRLKAVKEIVPGREGLTHVTIDKDRPGQVKRQQAGGKRIADLIVDSEGGDDEPVIVMLEAPGAIAGPPPSERPKGKPLDPICLGILAVLADTDELTAGQVTKALAENGNEVSESTIKRRLGDLDLWGRVALRKEINGKKEIGFWSLRDAETETDA